MKGTANTVMERCDLPANVSEERGLIVRPRGSRAMNEANSVVAGWMKVAAMATGRDEIGNRTLVPGSRLDTVRDAGRYVGVLGVMAAIDCFRQLHDDGERLLFAIEIVAFADDEGLSLGTTFLGSSAHAKRFDRTRSELENGDGVTLMKAVRVFGGDPLALEAGGRDPDDLIGYCELHVEQGPVLGEPDLPVGVVTAINGQSRVGVGFTGKAGHAGTVPMEDRRDALCAASEFVLEARRCSRSEPPAVATVGEIKALPRATNGVPGEARLSLEFRHPDGAARERARSPGGEGRRRSPQRTAARTSGSSSRRRASLQPIQSSVACSPEPTKTWGSRPPAPERRGPRRGGGGSHRPDRHALRALQRRHRPRPGRVRSKNGRRGRRGDGR